jgi:hypothetical protein
MSNNGEEPYDLSQEKIELDDFIIHHKKGKKVFTDALHTCSTVEDIKEFLTVFSNTYFLETDVLFYVVRTHIEHLQGIEKAIGALPDRREFDEVRQEMKKLKSRVRETLQPLKELLDESKKRADRGDDLYG